VRTLFISLVAVGVTLFGGAAHAVTTRTFRVTSYKDFDAGEAHGVVLSSLGEAQSGYGAVRTEIGESVVYASVTAPDGTVYLGTGDQGNVYAFSHGKLKKLAHLDAVLVTSLAIGPSGTLLAGAMPGGRVYTIAKDGKVKQLAKLDAEHVWALAYDEGKQVVYAATGPKGRLYAIDLHGLDRPFVGDRAHLVVETGEKHLLSLARGENGALYAGSSDHAILFRITPGASGSSAKLEALHDFQGEEIRAIARHGATLYVAVNQFQKSAAPSSTPSLFHGLPNLLAQAAATAPGRDRKGKGAVWRVDPDGRVEKLHELSDGYFTALWVDGGGDVWAAAGAHGRVYLIRPDRTVFTAFDLPERQVLTLALDGPEKVLGTGDAGAVYRVSNDPPKDAHYQTKVFDAQFLSRWGNVRYRGQGALSVQTRSGNTSTPDRTWSGWQSPSRAAPQPSGGTGRIASPEGRYLQVKVAFGAPRTTLRDLTVYYRPQNQRARVTEITVGDEHEAHADSATPRPHSPTLKLRWKVENPDGDELVYRVFYREETELNWKPLGGPEPLTHAEYDWSTESIPDGNYVIKVVASDERSNPAPDALTHELTSSPFLIDNRKPELTELKVAYPLAEGRARDSFSPISELAYSVDGGDWLPLAPKDGVLDDPVEDLSLRLPSGLGRGTHSLAVRAVDAAGNVGAAQTTFRVK
jgi:hypothetical protein